jgi:sporulation protein YlmC with PRC-barrel domain
MYKSIVISAAAALMMGVSATAYAQTAPENCQDLFQRADVNKDGSLQSDEAKVFIDAMSQAQVQPQDASMVTQQEFMAACEKNAFANIDPATIGQAAAQGEQPAATDESATGTATTTTTDPAATGTATTTDPAATGTATTTDPAATGTTAATDPAAPAEQPAQEQALAVPDSVMASNLIGANIYSNNNENIAEIKDVVLSEPEGQATHVIVDAGENDVAVDLKQLKIAATEDGLKIVLDGTQADLASFPVVNSQEQQQQQQQQQQ